jgi:transglutaminase-like putative cysteine protease
MRQTDGVACGEIDWSNVVAAAYRIDQSIRYDYARPISRLRHKLVISPRAAHGNQRRVSHDLFVSPDAPKRLFCDAFGNDVVALDVPHVERSIAFTFTSHVSRDLRLGEHLVADDPSADSPSCADPRAAGGQRRLVRPDEALCDIAADVRARYPDPEERAQAIADFVHREMVYTKGVTDVFTTGAVAFTMRRGVCQDYAHIAIALAHVCGLSARYVSGHLIGEGATHAWVEFLVPAGRDHARVLSLDPTNGCATNLRYIVVAIGRDYDDVAPTSGVFEGDAPGSIEARQSVCVTNVTYAA